MGWGWVFESFRLLGSKATSAGKKPLSDVSSHAMIYGHFRPRRHLMTAARHRCARAEAFRVWREETCVRMAA